MLKTVIVAGVFALSLTSAARAEGALAIVEDSREAAIASALNKCGEGAKNCKTFDTDCDR
ncbi:MAG: hypothetical protein K2P86_07345 [Xanthobacteraceae bacterium]|nr:hypothetical protein [Xanthobacteraceae bacterium]